MNTNAIVYHSSSSSSSIIITSRHQHVYPWFSLATLLYRPLLPASLQGYIQTQSWCMMVWASRPAFARSCEGVHRSMSLLSSSLLLHHYSAYLFRLTFIVFEMGGWWLYSCCFVGCRLQELFNISRSILV